MAARFTGYGRLLCGDKSVPGDRESFRRQRCLFMCCDACRCAGVKVDRVRVSGSQFGDLCRSLETIVETKFPDLRNITHDGYKLLGRGQLARLKRASSGEWKALVDSARGIPNLSDRAFVLGQMAGMLPPTESRMRSVLAREAKALVDQIPADSDKVDRLYSLALETQDFDPELTRECLTIGMRGCNSERDENLAYGQGTESSISLRELVCAGSRIGRQLGQRPARARLKSELSTSVREHDIRDSLISGKPIETAPKEKDLEVYCRAAWSALAELNAGRSVTARPDQAIRLVAKVADMPLSKSYPVYAWAIENEVRRFEDTDEVTSRLVPLFEETLLAAELSERIAARSAEQLERIQRASVNVPVLTEKDVCRGSRRESQGAGVSRALAGRVRCRLCQVLRSVLRSRRFRDSADAAVFFTRLSCRDSDEPKTVAEVWVCERRRHLGVLARTRVDAGPPCHHDSCSGYSGAECAPNPRSVDSDQECWPSHRDFPT